MIKAAIFDYGDTLVCPRASGERILSRALHASYSVLKHAGLQVPFEEFESVDESVFETFAEVEAQEDRDIPDIIKYQELVGTFFPTKSDAWRRRVANHANTAFWDAVARNHHVARGARRSLEELKSMGLKMAVLSNHHNHRALVGHLKQLDLDRYFSCIYSSDQLGVRKPNPKAFAKCLSTTRVGAAEAIFIGDSLKNDITGAGACGMKTTLVDSESEGRSEPGKGPVELAIPDFKVSKLEEVPGIIRRLNTA